MLVCVMGDKVKVEFHYYYVFIIIYKEEKWSVICALQLVWHTILSISTHSTPCEL